MPDKKFKKKILFFTLPALLFFLSSLFFYGWVSLKSRDLVSPVSQRKSVVLPTIPPAKKVFNVLLLGHGDASHPGGDLADALVVLHLDTEKKKAALISIPRDTWLTLPVGNGFESHKINEAYRVGKKAGGEETGFEMMRQAVTLVTDLPIHGYVFVDFRGFKQAIDILGGVPVDVPVAFDDYFYPIRGKELDNCGMSGETLSAINATMSGFALEKQYSCRYEHLHFERGETQMDGETALKFVRSRHSDQHGNDFARGERAQALLLGIKNKLLSLKALDDIPGFFEKLIYAVRTDLDVKILKEAAGMVVDPDDYSISQLVLSDQNAFDSSRNAQGQFILVPKAGEDQWQEVHALILKTLGGS